MKNVFIFVLCIAASVAARRYFLQITDEHLEYQYKAGTSTTKHWCRGPEKGNAGKYGDIGCHSPRVLIEKGVEAMKKHYPDPLFILATGDARRGFATVNGQKEVLAALKNLTNIYKKYFPKTKVFPTFGNHDTHPNNDHSPKHTWLFNGAADLWKDWLSANAQTTLRKYGYYEDKVGDFTILMLNTCMYLKESTSCNNITDPAGMLKYLEGRLSAAKTSGANVIIGAHCPPATNWRKTQFIKYTDIIRKYADVIVGQFYGHNHVDYFTLVYDKTGYRAQGAKAVGVSYLCPSIATRPGGPHMHNASFRAYIVDDKKPVLNSHETYYLPINYANKHNDPTFRLEYTTANSTVAALNIQPPLTPAKWQAIFEKLEKGNDALTRQFWNRLYIQTFYPTDKCDASCKKDILCKIRYGNDYTAWATCRSKGL